MSVHTLPDAFRVPFVQLSSGRRMHLLCQLPWRVQPPVFADAWFDDASGHWVEEREVEVEVDGKVARVKRRFYPGDER